MPRGEQRCADARSWVRLRRALADRGRAAIGLPAAQRTRADSGSAAGRRDQVPVARRDRGPQPGLQPLFGRDLPHLSILSEQGRLRPPADPARQRACAPAKRLIRKMGGSRSAPLLTLLYALTFARWSRHPLPAARRFQRASFDRGRSRLLSRGYRWFESISLQQTVCLSPAAAFSRCCRESLAVQARISITR